MSLLALTSFGGRPPWLTLSPVTLATSGLWPTDAPLGIPWVASASMGHVPFSIKRLVMGGLRLSRPLSAPLRRFWRVPTQNSGLGRSVDVFTQTRGQAARFLACVRAETQRYTSFYESVCGGRGAGEDGPVGTFAPELTLPGRHTSGRVGPKCGSQSICVCGTRPFTRTALAAKGEVWLVPCWGEEVSKPSEMEAQRRAACQVAFQVSAARV